MMTQDERQLLQETRDTVIELKTILMSPGSGLSDRVTILEAASGDEKSFRTKVMVVVSLALLVVEPLIYYVIDCFAAGSGGHKK
jgi:hypothetical protein